MLSHEVESRGIRFGQVATGENGAPGQLTSALAFSPPFNCRRRQEWSGQNRMNVGRRLSLGWSEVCSRIDTTPVQIAPLQSGCSHSSHPDRWLATQHRSHTRPRTSPFYFSSLAPALYFPMTAPCREHDVVQILQNWDRCPVLMTPGHEVRQTVQGTRLDDTIQMVAGQECRRCPSQIPETRGLIQ